MLLRAMLPVRDYLPSTGVTSGSDGSRIFNPSLTRTRTGIVAAYRWIDRDGRRAIAACRLTDSLEPVAGSTVALSTQLATLMQCQSDHSRSWFADPRLFELDGRLFITWNDGFLYRNGNVLPANNQFLAELDSTTLAVIPSVKRITKSDGQFRPEKNWMIFSDGGEWRAIYASSPHRVLSLASIEQKEIKWSDRFITYNANSYRHEFGEIRGGCQPVFRNGRYYHFAHSAYGDGGKRRYVALVYTFEAHPPYRVIATCRAPLVLPRLDERDMPDLPTLNDRASDVTYVTGAIISGDKWTLSYGQDDKVGLIASIPVDVIENILSDINGKDRVRDLASFAQVSLKNVVRHTLKLARRDAVSKYM